PVPPAPQAPRRAADTQEEPEPLGYADLVRAHGGLTALLLAVREGHADTAVALLDAGADINRVSAGDGTSPLLMATINGHFDLALTLIERGADVTLASEAGATPLYGVLNMQWAPKSRHPQPADYMQQKVGYLELMEVILRRGADVNARLTKSLWYTTYNRDLLGVDRTGATAFWLAAYTLDIPAMKLLLEYGADPSIRTAKVPERFEEGAELDGVDRSGLPPIPWGGPAVAPIHAASGVGYGLGFAGNSHRHVPDGWVPAVRFLVEELGADVNARDHHGFTPLHHAAARGDNDLIRYLVSKGADPTLVARTGQTTVDMANGPVQRIQPYPETIALLESLGAKNNHRCVSC
ncbi:MAG: ankyrin repeat domain-containing protein, partial [Acidobacteriota bacterium]